MYEVISPQCQYTRSKTETLSHQKPMLRMSDQNSSSAQNAQAFIGSGMILTKGLKLFGISYSNAEVSVWSSPVLSRTWWFFISRGNSSLHLSRITCQTRRKAKNGDVHLSVVSLSSPSTVWSHTEQSWGSVQIWCWAFVKVHEKCPSHNY